MGDAQVCKEAAEEQVPQAQSESQLQGHLRHVLRDAVMPRQDSKSAAVCNRRVVGEGVGGWHLLGCGNVSAALPSYMWHGRNHWMRPWEGHAKSQDRELVWDDPNPSRGGSGSSGTAGGAGSSSDLPTTVAYGVGGRWRAVVVMVAVVAARRVAAVLVARQVMAVVRRDVIDICP